LTVYNLQSAHKEIACQTSVFTAKLDTKDWFAVQLNAGHIKYIDEMFALSRDGSIKYSP